MALVSKEKKKQAAKGLGFVHNPSDNQTRASALLTSEDWDRLMPRVAARINADKEKVREAKAHWIAPETRLNGLKTQAAIRRQQPLQISDHVKMASTSEFKEMVQHYASQAKGDRAIQFLKRTAEMKWKRQPTGMVTMGEIKSWVKSAAQIQKNSHAIEAVLGEGLAEISMPPIVTKGLHVSAHRIYSQQDYERECLHLGITLDSPEHRFARAWLARKAQLMLDNLSPTEDLMREHALLGRMLLGLEHVAKWLESGFEVDTGALEQALLFINECDAEHHMVMEETYVFPLFEGSEHAELVAKLLEQHNQARETVAAMLEALPNLGDQQVKAQMGAQLCLLRQILDWHINQEETIIFPALRGMLSHEEWQSLSHQMAQMEKPEGVDFESCLARVEAVEQAFELPPSGKVAKTASELSSVECVPAEQPTIEDNSLVQPKAHQMIGKTEEEDHDRRFAAYVELGEHGFTASVKDTSDRLVWSLQGIHNEKDAWVQVLRHRTGLVARSLKKSARFECVANRYWIADGHSRRAVIEKNANEKEWASGLHFVAHLYPTGAVAGSEAVEAFKTATLGDAKFHASQKLALSPSPQAHPKASPHASLPQKQPSSVDVNSTDPDGVGKSAQIGDFEKSYSLLDACKHAAQRMPADAKTMEGNAAAVLATFSTDEEAERFSKFVGPFLADEHGIYTRTTVVGGEGPVPTVSIAETGRIAKQAQSAILSAYHEMIRAYQNSDNARAKELAEQILASGSPDLDPSRMEDVEHVLEMTGGMGPKQGQSGEWYQSAPFGWIRIQGSHWAKVSKTAYDDYEWEVRYPGMNGQTVESGRSSMLEDAQAHADEVVERNAKQAQSGWVEQDAFGTKVWVKSYLQYFAKAVLLSNGAWKWGISSGISDFFASGETSNADEAKAAVDVWFEDNAHRMQGKQAQRPLGADGIGDAMITRQLPAPSGPDKVPFAGDRQTFENIAITPDNVVHNYRLAALNEIAGQSFQVRENYSDFPKGSILSFTPLDPRKVAKTACPEDLAAMEMPLESSADGEEHMMTLQDMLSALALGDVVPLDASKSAALQETAAQAIYCETSEPV